MLLEGKTGLILGEGASEADLLVHNEQHPSPAYPYMLASMDSRPGFPTPVGVLRAVDAPIYEDGVNDQVKQIIAKKGRGDLGKLLHGPETWEIRQRPARSAGGGDQRPPS